MNPSKLQNTLSDLITDLSKCIDNCETFKELDNDKRQIRDLAKIEFDGRNLRFYYRMINPGFIFFLSDNNVSFRVDVAGDFQVVIV